MLQDIHNMEASCGLYVKVGTFTHLEPSRNLFLLAIKWK